MTPGTEVEVRKVLGGGPRNLLRRWCSGYRYARTEEGGAVIVLHTEGIYDGLESRYPAEDVREKAARHNLPAHGDER